MEACTFQDITGQRVTKIVRSMQFVEERVNSMVSLWGSEAIEETAATYGNTDGRDGDEKLLNGPALPSETSISQDEIDKLFD
jgi:chemotaxis protein CheZ